MRLDIGASVNWKGVSGDLQRDDFLLVVAKQVGVEADKMLADVQAALQQYSLPQSADKLITDVLHCRVHIKQLQAQHFTRCAKRWD